MSLLGQWSLFEKFNTSGWNYKEMITSYPEDLKMVSNMIKVNIEYDVDATLINLVKPQSDNKKLTLDDG